MTKITQENAVEELLKRIPEIKEYSGEYSSWEHTKEELDSPTIVFDCFGSFLLDEILSKPPREDVIKKSFDLQLSIKNLNKYFGEYFGTSWSI